MKPGSNLSRGTVSLVALCFVAVLGIALSSYLAICTHSMNLSNRSFQSGLSQQLAEFGLEEGLRAFNKGDWSGWAADPSGITGATAAWTLDTTNKRATRILTFDNTRFGQNVTATVKIRVDNYDANQLSSNWNNTTNYRPNDLVGNNGIWYRCVVANSGQTPTNPTNLGSGSSSNATFWIEEQMPLQIPWSYPITYKTEDVVYYGGAWYRCISAHTSSATLLPTSTSYWTQISVITTNPWTAFSNDESLLNYWSGSSWAWYRYNSGWDSTPAISWRWRGSRLYSVNDVVSYNGLWYRCISPTSSSSTPAANTACWSSSPSTAAWAWSSSTINYALWQVVYYSGTGKWYRCIRAHTSGSPANITPPNTTYWTDTPLLSTAWNSDRQYSQNDTVRYNGVWYRSLQNNSIGQNPLTASTYWIGANTTTASYVWSSTTAYSSGDYCCYDGAWYKCIANTTAGISPNDLKYWSNAWAQSSGSVTGAPVIYAEATVLSGSTPSLTQIRAAIAPAILFPNAVAATSSISANSGGTVDSYDSTTGTSALQPGSAGSTAGTSNGIYGTYASQIGTSTNYSAVIAAGGPSGTAITLTSTTVSGYLAVPSNSTSPFAPLYSVGSSAAVKGVSSPGFPNVDASHVSRSPSIPVFDTLPGGAGGLAATWPAIPLGTLLPTTGGSISLGTPGATTPARYYYNGSYTIGTPTLTNVKIIGPVILYINGDLFITASGSTGRIDIASTGSAEIHVAGAFKADAIGEGIQNYTADPKSLIIICDTTSSADHYYSEGVNDLYGVIYIPYSSSANGYFNNNNNAEIFGAICAKKITYSGANLNVHYDTSLRYATFGGVDQPYSVTHWRELPTSERYKPVPPAPW